MAKEFAVPMQTFIIALRSYEPTGTGTGRKFKATFLIVCQRAAAANSGGQPRLRHILQPGQPVVDVEVFIPAEKAPHFYPVDNLEATAPILVPRLTPAQNRLHILRCILFCCKDTLLPTSHGG